MEPLDWTTLIDALADALLTYDRLVFDDEDEHPLGKPCTPAQLSRLERRFGHPLPPSWRTFLSLHNGWTDLTGDARLLSVEDQASDWVRERLDDIDELYEEFGGDNPFAAGALPVFLGEDSHSVLLVDPRTVRPDGEMDFVALDIIREEQRFPDLGAFLAHKLATMQRLIAAQRDGSTEPTEDD